jgi:hypothetical protein
MLHCSIHHMAGKAFRCMVVPSKQREVMLRRRAIIRRRTMCLSAHALALFLNLLDPSIVTTESGRITVLATERPVVWVRGEEKWCTMGPQISRMARFN